MRIRAVLFDMDGTIYDSRIDWRALRDEIGLPYDGRPILQQLAEAPEPLRQRGLEALHRTEREGAENGELLPGAAELVAMLRSQGVQCALITNNSRPNAEKVLSRHPIPFDLVLTRDDGAAKPDPGIFERALRELAVRPTEAVAIGDAHLDVIAAAHAGIGQIIAVGMPEWMATHVPREIPYRKADDLHQARELISEMFPR